MSHIGCVNEVVSDTKAVVDIVFVHGIGTRWESTWSGADPSKTWLRTLLLTSRELPRPRILTYGFDVLDTDSHNESFHEDSRRLLDGLQELRKTKSEQVRPIIFLAHSLGCLILQSALTGQFPDTDILKGAIRGIIFFAPPHFSADASAWTQFEERIARTVTTSHSSDLKLDLFTRFSQLNDNFLSWHKRTSTSHRLSCFYEALPLYRVGIVVPRESVKLAKYGNNGSDVDHIDMNADHFDMTRFQDVSDPSYQKVMQRIKFLTSSTPKPSQDISTPVPRRKAEGFVLVEDIWDSKSIAKETKSSATMANTLENQGHYKAAEYYYRLAIEDYSADKEQDRQQEIFYCTDRLSALLRDRGAFKEAFELGESVLSKREDQYGLEDRETLASCGNLALIMRCQGRHQDAFLMLRQAFENTHQSPLNSISKLRNASILARLFDDCGLRNIPWLLLRDLIATTALYLEEDHPFLLRLKSELSSVLSSQAGRAELQQSFDQKLESSVILQKPHNHTLLAAENILSQSVIGLEKKLGRNHPYALLAGRELGSCHRVQGDYDQASWRLERVTASQRSQFSLNHPSTLATLSELAAVYVLQGYVGEALVILQQTYESQDNILGCNHPDTLWSKEALRLLRSVPSEDMSDPDVWILRPKDMSEATLRAIEFFGLPTRLKHEIELTSGAQFWDHKPISSATQALYTNNKTELEKTLEGFREDSLLLGQLLRVAAGDTKLSETIESLLRWGAKVNSEGGYYGTALQAASGSGQREIVKLLLDHGADVNTQSGILGSALRAATVGGFEDIVSLLLQCGADPNLASPGLTTVLQLAVSCGHTTIIQHLLDFKVNVKTYDYLFGSPLQEACASGNVDVVRLLLDNGADPLASGGLYGNPGMAALKNGHTQVLECLMDQNVAVLSYAMIQDTNLSKLGGQDHFSDLLLVKKKPSQVIVEFEQDLGPAASTHRQHNSQKALPKALRLGGKKQWKRLRRGLARCVKWSKRR